MRSRPRGILCVDKIGSPEKKWKTFGRYAFYLRKTAIFSNIAPIAFISYCKIDKWSILKDEVGGTKILSLSHAQHIAPRPAGQYPDISLAPNNPWIAHPKIIIKSQDNYLLGKNSFTNFKSALNYRFYLHKGATCATFVTCATKLLVQLVHLPAASPS